MPEEKRYDVFISYSRKDIDFARALEKALEKYSPPRQLGIGTRRLRAFRDESDITGPEYEEAIKKRIRQSSSMIVVCSPHAAQSRFVQQEIEWFAEEHEPRRVIPVLVAGLPNNETGPDQAGQAAFPAILLDLLSMPLAVEYRGISEVKNKVKDIAYRNSWFTLLANIYELERSEIEQRDLRRQRTRRITLAAITAGIMASLTALAITAWIQKLAADEQKEAALSAVAANLADKAQAAMPTKPEEAVLLAIESVRATRDVIETHTQRAEQVLRDVLIEAGGRSLRGRREPVEKLAVGPNGEQLYSYGTDGIWSWSLKDADAEPRRIAGFADAERITKSADGTWAVVQRPGEFELQDLGDLTHRTGVVFEFDGEATNVALSDEGRLAIAANDAVIHVFDREAASAEPRILAGHEPRDSGGLLVLKFSPDGRHLLSIGWDKTLRRWDLSGPCIQPETVELSEIFVTDAAFSPDGRWLVTAGWSAPTLLWNVFDLESGGTEWEAAAGARTRVFSPDSHWLGVVNAEGNLWLRDMEAGEAIKLASLDPRTHIVAFSPDSKQLFAAGNEPEGYLWELDKIRRRPDVLGGGNYPIKSVVFSPDGEKIVTGSRGLLTIWQTEDPEDALPVSIAGHGTAFDESVFFDDGRKLATASGPAVTLWSLDNPHAGSALVDQVASGSLKQIRGSGGALSSLEGKMLGGVANAAAFSPDDGWFAVALEREFVAVVNLSEPGQPITRLGPHGFDVTALAFSGNGQTLITAGAHFNLKIWHMQALERDPMQLPSVESQNESSVAALAASPDSRWIAAGAAFGEVALWDTLKADDAPKLLHEHEGWVVSVAFSGDGQWLLTSSEDGTAKVWDTRDFDARPRTLKHGEAAIRAKFSPGGETVATAGQDAAARLWRITEPDRPPRVLLGHEDSIIDMAFSPDNQRLATAGEDGRVYVWNIASPEVNIVAELEHASIVEAVAFRHDSGALATAASDTVVKLWDPKQFSSTPLLLRGHRDRVWWAGFSPNGRTLATVSSDGTARLWPLEMEELVIRACSVVHLNLPYKAWTDARGEQPYRKTCNALPAHPSLEVQGKTLARQGDLAGGLNLLARYKQLEPHVDLDPDAEARRLAIRRIAESGMRLARDQKVEAATAQFRRALVIDPAWPHDPVKLATDLATARQLKDQAENAAKRGAVDNAIEAFEEAIALDPEIKLDPVVEANRLAVPVLRQQARRLAEALMIDESIEKYRKILAMDPDRNFDPVERAHYYAATRHRRDGNNLAKEGRIDEAIAAYRKATKLNSKLEFDATVTARKLAAPSVAEEGRLLIREGKIAEGLTRLENAERFDPELRITAVCWNHACWWGALHNQPSPVKTACRRAIELDPENARIRDSRGMVRAISGDHRGAIEDFEAYVESQSGGSDRAESVVLRRSWIARLEQNQNPITQEVLDDLRERERRFISLSRCTEKRP